MGNTNKTYLLVVFVMAVLLPGTLISCAKANTIPTTSPGSLGGSLVQTDSIITGEIKAINSMTTGYP